MVTHQDKLTTALDSINAHRLVTHIQHSVERLVDEFIDPTPSEHMKYAVVGQLNLMLADCKFKRAVADYSTPVGGLVTGYTVKKSGRNYSLAVQAQNDFSYVAKCHHRSLRLVHGEFKRNHKHRLMVATAIKPIIPASNITMNFTINANHDQAFAEGA